MKYISCWILRIIISVYAVFPFSIIYFFSDITYFLLFYAFRYRRKVVYANIKASFPGKSHDEIFWISKAFYRHFCDILLESMKAFSMSDRDMIDRYKVLNPELLDKFYLDNKSVIAIAGHYNNWEWGSVSACLQLKHKPVGFYKPLSNSCVDDFIRHNRERNGALVVSIKNTSETFEKYINLPSVFMMVADQSPSRVEFAHWKIFLNRQTAFLHGPEKYARLKDLPVVYVDIEKMKRGYYTLTFKLLTEHPDEIPPEGITGMFVNELEKTILSKPEYWLWSHKRWKHVYNSQSPSGLQ